MTVNPALGTPTLTSNPTLPSTQNVGNTITFTASWTGGTPDYTAKLYSSTTSTCNTGSTLIQTISSLTGVITTFNAVTPASNTYYCIFLTDSATTPVTVLVAVLIITTLFEL